MFVGGGAIAVASQLFSLILFADSYYTAWIYIPILAAATVFTSLDTFLGSVYFTVKRTSMSLWTSLVGAVLNMALNFLLIPKFGALGASAATFASYFAVYVIRAATMRSFLPFRMYHGKLAVNTVMISAIAIIMTWWGNDLWGILTSLGILLLSVAFNSRDVIKALRQLLSSVKEKRISKVQ